MRCGFVVLEGLTCPRPPEEGRRIHVQDVEIEVLLCAYHALVYDNKQKGETQVRTEHVA